MNSLSLLNDAHSGVNYTPVHTVELLVVLVGLTEEFLSVCVCVLTLLLRPVKGSALALARDSRLWRL